MKSVQFGKQWEIKSYDDYIKAMDILEENLFVARMSDCFAVEMEETAEISRQRRDVMKQFVALDI